MGLPSYEIVFVAAELYSLLGCKSGCKGTTGRWKWTGWFKRSSLLQLISLDLLRCIDFVNSYCHVWPFCLGDEWVLKIELGGGINQYQDLLTWDIYINCSEVRKNLNLFNTWLSGIICIIYRVFCKYYPLWIWFCSQFCFLKWSPLICKALVIYNIITITSRCFSGAKSQS